MSIPTNANVLCLAGRKIRPNDVAKVQSITRQFMLQMEAITIASKAINQAREIDY